MTEQTPCSVHSPQSVCARHQNFQQCPPWMKLPEIKICFITHRTSSHISNLLTDLEVIKHPCEETVSICTTHVLIINNETNKL